jgi:hypothetical protein
MLFVKIVQEKEALYLGENFYGHPVIKVARCQPPSTIFCFVDLPD